MRPPAAPHDVMHLLMQIVARLLWRLFVGKVRVGGTPDRNYVIPAASVALVGLEMAVARYTVPMAQARSLRYIDPKCLSFKAVNWMYCLVVGGRAPGESLVSHGRHNSDTIRQSVVPVSSIMCANYVSQTLGICFSTIWRKQI